MDGCHAGGRGDSKLRKLKTAYSRRKCQVPLPPHTTTVEVAVPRQHHDGENSILLNIIELDVISHGCMHALKTRRLQQVISNAPSPALLLAFSTTEHFPAPVRVLAVRRCVFGVTSICICWDQTVLPQNVETAVRAWGGNQACEERQRRKMVALHNTVPRSCVLSFSEPHPVSGFAFCNIMDPSTVKRSSPGQITTPVQTRISKLDEISVRIHLQTR